METAKNLRSDIDAALRRSDLNAWQRTFLNDILARIDRGGDRFTLTEKQWSKVFEVLGSRSNVVTLRQRTSAQFPHRQPGNFRPKYRKRRSHRLTWSQKILVAVLVLLAVIACFQVITGHKFDVVSAPPSSASSDFSSSRFSVTDGDTIHVDGEVNGTRLVGYNAPEVFSPRCASEKELGDRATDRLKELVRAGPVNLSRVPCACIPGTEGTDRCNYGRSCAVLYVSGRDVSSIMVGEGLAVPFVCSKAKCPPTPRPWCG
ncbi:thermonuclease family protein [Rhizobium cauense]|uniref:thermonuclease family protein n=1 Tax=Rhizobium cauense TaxID=1166683 RepID=UPI001C6EA9AF|nr:thermonuclease family protein [Rhizobium cauense]MBW9114590.1 thermonuclease family protein [Rhizobium cauense]